MDETEKDKDSARRTAWVAAAAVFVAGFGVLSLIWEFGTWPREVLGFFHYRSAWLGDGLLLPLMAASLIIVIRKLPTPINERRWMAVAAVAGFAGGLSLQLLWLADPDPTLNWTLPAPHRFNAAGVYHAVFLTCATGLFFGLWVVVVRRLRVLRATAPTQLTATLTTPAAFTALAALMAFIGLVLLDNRGFRTQAILATLAAIGGAAVGLALLLFSALGTNILQARRTLLLAAATAAGLSMLAAQRPHTHGGAEEVALSVLVLLLIMLALAAPIRRRARRGLGPAIVSLAFVLSGALAVAVQQIHRSVLQAGVVAVLGAAVATMIPLSLLFPREARLRAVGKKFVLVVLAVSYPVMNLALAHWLRELGPRGHGQAETAVDWMPALLPLILPLTYVLFGVLIKAERTGASTTDSVALSSLQATTWLQIVGFAASAVVSLVVLFVAVAPTLGVDPAGAGASDGRIVSTALWSLLAACLTGLGLLMSLIGRPGSFLRRSATSFALLGPLLFGVAMVSHRAPVTRLPWLVVPAAAIMGLLAAESVIFNSARLHLRAEGWAGRIIGASCGFGTGSAMFWLLSSAVWSGGLAASLPVSMGAALVALCGGFVMTTFAGIVLARLSSQRHLTPYPPHRNLLQDQIVYLALGFFFALVPVLAIARLQGSGGSPIGSIRTGLLEFAGAIGFFYGWVLKNNREHLNYERIKSPPDAVIDRANGNPEEVARLNDERVRQLSFHVKFQNRFSLALAVVSIVGVVGYAFSLVVEGLGLKEIVELEGAAI